MNTRLTEITYDVQLAPGEMLSLPKEWGDILGPGHWVVSIRPAQEESVQMHAAFLKSYSPEDEGLYDDY